MSNVASKIWVIGYLAILVSSLLPAQWILTNFTANRMIARGQSFIQAGNLQRAASDFSHAVTLRPDWGEFRFYLGKALSGTGQYERAVSELRKAEATYHNFQLYQVLGTVLAMTGKDAEALAAYERGLCFARDDEELLTMKTKLLIAMAEKLFQPLILSEDHPDTGDDLLRLGQSAWPRARLHQALTLLQSAPDIPDPALRSTKDCLMASILAVLGETDRAFSSVTKGLHVNPYSIMGLLWGARLSAQQGAIDLAINLYDALLVQLSVLDESLLTTISQEAAGLASIVTEPSLNQRLRLISAEAALKAAKPDLVDASLSAMIPQHRVRYLLGLHAEKLGDKSRARSWYQQLLAEEPGYLDALRGSWVTTQDQNLARPQRMVELYLTVAP